MRLYVESTVKRGSIYRVSTGRGSKSLDGPSVFGNSLANDFVLTAKGIIECTKIKKS